MYQIQSMYSKDIKGDQSDFLIKEQHEAMKQSSADFSKEETIVLPEKKEEEKKAIKFSTETRMKTVLLEKDEGKIRKMQTRVQPKAEL